MHHIKFFYELPVNTLTEGATHFLSVLNPNQFSLANLNVHDRKDHIRWPTDTDRYGRTVAFVFVGDIDLNKELLKAGLAWHYKQYSRDPELAKLEFQARSKKLGLWSEPVPVPPWEWRKQKRSGRSSKVQNVVSKDTDAPYHGNTSSKVFHRQGCRYYDCKNCTVLFSSRRAAVNAGYKPCGICRS